MLLSKPPKVQYSEIEAAEILGLSIEQLRSLVKSHIVKDDAEGTTPAVTSFQPSDLVLLRILSGRGAQEIAT